MKKTKLCRAVLAETKEKSRICHLTAKGKEFNDLRYLDVDAPIILDSINYQLILISLEPDEKIEVGNKYYSVIHNQIFECIHNEQYFENEYKIIVTQEQLPPEYIKQFIEEYNNGNVQDIEIEMEEDIAEYVGPFNPDAKTYEPKLTNGFVTIITNSDKIFETVDDTSDDDMGYSTIFY